MAYSSSLLNGTTTNLSYKDTSLKNDNEEEIIVVDSGLRNIIVPQSLKTVGVAGDQYCEALFFQVPRYFDGNDLSKHNPLVRFINAGNEYGEYPITDIAVDENFIVLGWSVSNYVTRYAGTVNFTIQFDTVTENGVKYQWQTVPAQLTVLAGLKIESTITDKDDTLFRKLSTQVQILQDKVIVLEAKVMQLENKNVELDILKDKVNYMEDHVVYTVDTV